MIEFWFITIIKPLKILIMKKSVNPFMLFAFVVFAVTMMHGMGCKKSTGDEECRTCKAISVDNIEDEEEVCSESEETAFRNKNSGFEIVCD
jgi:hypothetical protein